MSYKSIDTLQKALSKEVFSHTKDAKKAAGRSLGTLIEIIAYYLLREWGLGESVAIERALAEYGNPSITHNVEFSLHPISRKETVKVKNAVPISSVKLLREMEIDGSFSNKSNFLIDKDMTLRNSCLVAEGAEQMAISFLRDINDEFISVEIIWQHKRSYAMFECKRVGVEEGCKKGPQTIEKAKQGAYVALNTSSLQKIRNGSGERYGLLYDKDKPIIKPYSELLAYMLEYGSEELLKGFTLSVGIVSNHGNWFTSEDQNKELKVLAQSYDWLLFLTDAGLAQFIDDLIMSPSPEYALVQRAFYDSYKEGKKANVFTKVKMNIKAHYALCTYFHNNIEDIEGWFNIIAPNGQSIDVLKKQLYILKGKTGGIFYDSGT